MTLDEILKEYEQEKTEADAATKPEREYWAARQFMAERPDFAPTPTNGKRIEKYIEDANLDSTNPDHIHQAVRALEQRGLLQLDPSKLVTL